MATRIVSTGLLFLMLFLAACTQGTAAPPEPTPTPTPAPVTLGSLADIGSFPNAQPLNEEQVAEVVEQIRTAYTDVSLETNQYIIPQGTSFENVKEFYTTQLIGWEPVTSVRETLMPNVQVAAWSREAQAVVVILIQQGTTGIVFEVLGDSSIIETLNNFNS